MYIALLSQIICFCLCCFSCDFDKLFYFLNLRVLARCPFRVKIFTGQQLSVMQCHVMEEKAKAVASVHYSVTLLFSLCLKHALEAFMVMNSLLTNAKRNMPRAIHLDLQFHITTIKKN